MLYVPTLKFILPDAHTSHASNKCDINASAHDQCAKINFQGLSPPALAPAEDVTNASEPRKMSRADRGMVSCPWKAELPYVHLGYSKAKNLFIFGQHQNICCLIHFRINKLKIISNQFQNNKRMYIDRILVFSIMNQG